MTPIHLSRPLENLSRLFPGLESLLPRLNQSLRNINFGKMDHLPYYDAVPGYQFAMRAALEPQGGQRPPAVGHWQLEITKDESNFQLRLQGKSKGETEIAEILFLCGPTSESEELQNSE